MGHVFPLSNRGLVKHFIVINKRKEKKINNAEEPADTEEALLKIEFSGH
jgi:hypothetical protein